MMYAEVYNNNLLKNKVTHKHSHIGHLAKAHNGACSHRVFVFWSWHVRTKISPQMRPALNDDSDSLWSLTDVSMDKMLWHVPRNLALSACHRIKRKVTQLKIIKLGTIIFLRLQISTAAWVVWPVRSEAVVHTARKYFDLGTSGQRLVLNLFRPWVQQVWWDN